jgi:hypothetical protein
VSGQLYPLAALLSGNAEISYGGEEVRLVPESGQRVGKEFLDPTGTRTPNPRTSNVYSVAIPIALTRFLVQAQL